LNVIKEKTTDRWLLNRLWIAIASHSFRETGVTKDKIYVAHLRYN